MVHDIIRCYKNRLSEIYELIEDLNDNQLCLRSDRYPPATICHPIWTLGHLCISAQGIGEEMSLSHWLDKEWTDLYGQYSDPSDDPSRYHDVATLRRTLRECESILEIRLHAMTKDEIEGPMPDTRYHHIFPTLGHAISGILIDHISEHVRMLIVWKYYLL
jgi:hypothetical protein